MMNFVKKIKKKKENVVGWRVGPQPTMMGLGLGFPNPFKVGPHNPTHLARGLWRVSPKPTHQPIFPSLSMMIAARWRIPFLI